MLTPQHFQAAEGLGGELPSSLFAPDDVADLTAYLQALIDNAPAEVAAVEDLHAAHVYAHAYAHKVACDANRPASRSLGHASESYEPVTLWRKQAHRWRVRYARLRSEHGLDALPRNELEAVF